MKVKRVNISMKPHQHLKLREIANSRNTTLSNLILTELLNSKKNES